jgi:hypothetical protein
MANPYEGRLTHRLSIARRCLDTGSGRDPAQILYANDEYQTHIATICTYFWNSGFISKSIAQFLSAHLRGLLERFGCHGGTVP